ncbi:MAG TPA: hypothetical protein ENJ51_00925 [Leucothrix mucor]|uniref:Sialate O-acetylesterase domain-containing protein n=1 Tax=Leucothrix mucor TaxID=45248 RepID=A0A7V2T0F5_LEUMU|nr:hypothetical protein [Leucothrix mucor]
MLKKSLLLVYLLLSPSLLFAETFDLFIMGGQSNMQGWRSDAAQYPQSGIQFDADIPFYWEAVDYASSKGEWRSLEPQAGHFAKGHFGPEIMFARQLKRSGFHPAIFKYSFGSSNLRDVWKAPGKGGLYDKMTLQVKRAIKLLKFQGHTVNIRAFVWIQGESDADTDKLAKAYYHNLRNMLNHFRRNIVKQPNLPILLGLDEQHPRVVVRPAVIAAQKKIAAEDATIDFTSMRGLEKSDVTHLTAKGVIAHGERLYTSYIKLTYLPPTLETLWKEK